MTVVASLSCSVNDGSPSGAEFTGDARYQPLIDEIDDMSNDFGLSALLRTESVLRANGFPVAWFQDYVEQRLRRTLVLKDTGMNPGEESGEFTLCLEDACHDIVLFEDAGPSLAIDGHQIYDVTVASPPSVDAWGWCSGNTAVVLGTAPDGEFGGLALPVQRLG